MFTDAVIFALSISPEHLSSEVGVMDCQMTVVLLDQPAVDVVANVPCQKVQIGTRGVARTLFAGLDGLEQELQP